MLNHKKVEAMSNNKKPIINRQQKLWKFNFHRLNGFTLIEVLVVVGLIAVLSTIVLLTLNPLDFLKQGRDSTRLNDLSNLLRTLNYIKAESPQTFFGNAKTIYISRPDPNLTGDATSTCPNMNLPSIPTDWSYYCVSQENLSKIDGKGWIPIDFRNQAIFRLSKLPVDPKNDENYYYTYVYDPNTQTFEINTVLESEKQKHLLAEDNGDNDNLYELGTNLTLYPVGGIGQNLVLKNESSQNVKNESNFLIYVAQAAGTGQVSFFIAPDQVTGDNNLFWDNTNKRLGIGTTNPAYKLSIVGTENTSQLVVRAFSGQSNSNPLIKVENSGGSELFRIHSDNLNNIFIGYNSGLNNNIAGGDNGLYNTYLGSGAGQNGSTNFRSTALGYKALYSSTASDRNTAVGEGALYSLNNGCQNVAVGSETMYFFTSGCDNIAMGRGALREHTSGDGVTALGKDAFRGNGTYSTGNYMTAVGFRAGYYTNGDYNTFIGAYSGYALSGGITGTRNVFIGYQAGYWPNLGTGSSGSNNVIIGSQAGYVGGLNSSGNVFIGYQAGYNETGSNKLYIANSSSTPPLIYGDFVSGNVGLGTTNPTSKLHIIGDLTVSGTKNFEVDYPGNPNKKIVYVALEGPEAGTYVRGSAVCENGEKVINFPDYFSLVTSDKGLTANLTPRNNFSNLYIKELTNEKLIVGCEMNNSFDYTVFGLRKGYENFEVIRLK